MAVEVIMPKFGLTMHEGTIQRWLKAEGEEVKSGDPLFEVETEKVLYEVESPATGVLARVIHAAESTVPIKTVVAVIAEGGENPAEVAARYSPARMGAPAAGPPGPAVAAARPRSKRLATPAARKLAERLSLDLGVVPGTGPGGRISREDVQRAALREAPSLRTLPLSTMRKTIAERMQRSLQDSAQLTVTTEADVTALVLRRRILPKEITYTDLVTKATAEALGQHPLLNSRLEANRILLLGEINIGLAVALEEGLLAPVIRQVERKNLSQIARERAALVERAKKRQLSADELAGATFTITNLGPYGIDAFTPIVQMPQVAILGVGRIVEKPRFSNGELTNKRMMALSLSFDHRVVDGAPAAAFLQTVATLLGER